jgi:hypothetical protein
MSERPLKLIAQTEDEVEFKLQNLFKDILCCSYRWDETMSLNCGHQRAYCSSSMWYISMDRHGGIISTGNSWFSTRAVWQFFQESNLVRSRRNVAKEWYVFPYEISLSHSQGCITHSKSYMGPLALLHLWRKSCCWFLSTLKIHCPRPGLTSRTLRPMSSTLNSRPPSTTKT